MGYRDAVNASLGDTGKVHERRRNFGGRDVFALPAERVASPIDEIKEAVGVPTHQIAGPVPGIATLEHVPNYLSLCFDGTRIALEFAAGLSPAFADLPDCFADFVYGTTDAVPVRVA